MRIEDAWRLQRQWSVTATELDRWQSRWRSASLGLSLAGAVLGALAAQDGWYGKPVTVSLGVVGAVALALAGVIQAQLLTAARARARVGTRAGSEALKGIVFQFLAAVAPFDGQDAEHQLSLKVAEIEGLSVEHASLVVDAEPDNRPLPALHGVGDYVTQRVEEQRDWHRNRISDHKRLAGRWRTTQLIATAAAAVLAAAGGVLHGPDLSAWVAVATTAGAAIGAHIAAVQHEAIVDSYTRTVLALDAALRDFDAGQATPQEAAAFVAAVENRLAAQNNSWTNLFTSHA